MVASYTAIREWGDNAKWTDDIMDDFVDGLESYLNSTLLPSFPDKLAAATIVGSWSFTGTNTFSNSNTFSGNNLFSGTNLFSGPNSFTGGLTISGAIASSGTNTFTGVTTFSGVDTLKIPNATPTTGTGSIGVTTGVLSVYDGTSVLSFTPSSFPLMLGGVVNIGCSYSAGTFKILGANGSDFSATNYGSVVVPHSTAGRNLVLKATTTASFIDDAGASEIVGEEFGVTTGIAWGNARPFFIYAVNTSDADAGLYFALSPNPAATSTPSSANNLGKRGTPASTPSDGNFFFLTTSAVNTFTSKPCVCIGSINMTMSSSDDWTVATLTNAVGIGRFQEGVHFTFPLAQMGAATGTYFATNGGTAPLFTTNRYTYTIDSSGWVRCNVMLDGDPGTDGAGAVSSSLMLPYKIVTGIASMQTRMTIGQVLGATTITDFTALVGSFDDGTSYITLLYNNTAVTDTNIQNGMFTNGGRTVGANFVFPAFGR